MFSLVVGQLGPVFRRITAKLRSVCADAAKPSASRPVLSSAVDININTK